MKTNHLFSVFLFSGCIISIAYSQQIKIDQTIKGKNIPQINYVFNRISGNINSFYEKLTNLKKHDTGVVRIVHIGDSYIQAGFLTGTIRTDLQEIFVMEDVGWFFLQVAETNAPDDVKSSSNMHWQTSKLGHFEKNFVRSFIGKKSGRNYLS